VIEEIRLQRLRLPLEKPYKLALGPVTAFDTILAKVVVGGREGHGEATILTGYTDETIANAWPRAGALARRLAGASVEAARARIASDLVDTPFTATAFASAIEMAGGHPILDVRQPESVPLLAGINATDPAGIEREIEAAIAKGFGTLKIKVGFDLAADLARGELIQRCNRGRARLRIDANQGYSLDDGVRFAAEVAPDHIELLEQPRAAEDWAAAAAVAKVENVPLMLDESIYGAADIERAAEIGAAFVKLKLMKMGSLMRLIEGLELIRRLGMEPVLGNGVASDLGCWMEACVARQHIRNAGEMNGFLRQQTPLARAPLQIVEGRMQLLSGRALALDEDRIAAQSVAAAWFGRQTAGDEDGGRATA
jgi:L-alanine-DL-glutamate epimerase-like enolase superfamily enzyme